MVSSAVSSVMRTSSSPGSSNSSSGVSSGGSANIYAYSNTSYTTKNQTDTVTISQEATSKANAVNQSSVSSAARTISTVAQRGQLYRNHQI